MRGIGRKNRGIIMRKVLYLNLKSKHTNWKARSNIMIGGKTKRTSKHTEPRKPNYQLTYKLHKPTTDNGNNNLQWNGVPSTRIY